MEGIGNQARCSVILVLLMFIIIPVLTIQQLEEERCPAGDYETEEGICCNKCSPGFKLLEKCHVSGHRSKCTPCIAGEFSDQMNSMSTCRRCKKCKASRNEYQVSPCQKHQNTICRCKKDYYKFSIDTETYECVRCKKCRTDEIEIQPCTHEKNTVCECKESYYRLKDQCEPCSGCTLECAQHCSTPVKTKVSVSTSKPVTNTVTTGPDQHHPQFINIIVGSVVAVFVLLAWGIFITYMATKHLIKRKMRSQSSIPSDTSKEASKDFLVSFNEHSEEVSLRTAVETPLGEQELSKLPDCVPMIPDLIYAVLDLVPVHHVKQLVRSLGVTDMEIEQAEMDHRFCREAHYQMLRAWAQRSSQAVGGGQGEMVHRPLLEELLDKLRQVHLSRAAEELETKYDIQ